jgi:uncharacterized membrane protein
MVMSYNRAARIAFATGIIGFGIVGIVHGDFDAVWRGVPASVPGRQALEYATAALLLACGCGLLSRRTERLAIRVLLPLLALVVLLLKIPIVANAPLVEGSYQSLSEMVVVLTGAWVLCAVANERALRAGQIVFGLALIPLGLAHFVYLDLTAPLVPAWLPWHTGWAYLTGAAQIAAGVAVLIKVYAPLAATLEAVMLTAFTVLVWIPQLVAAPTSHGLWSELTASWAVSAGAWVVAASLSNKSLDAHSRA